jgi:hypothetical protein
MPPRARPELLGSAATPAAGPGLGLAGGPPESGYFWVQLGPGVPADGRAGSTDEVPPDDAGAVSRNLGA